MSGTRCAVFGCNNTYQKTKTAERKLSLHVFPKAKDSDSQIIRKAWVNRCSRTDNFNPDTSRICSDHFADADYGRDLQNELLGLPLKKMLKRTAVPNTIGIPKDISRESQSACDHDEGCEKIKQEVVEKNSTLEKILILEGLSSSMPGTSEISETAAPITIIGSPKKVHQKSQSSCDYDERCNEIKQEGAEISAENPRQNELMEENSILQGNVTQHNDYEKKYADLLREHCDLKSKFCQTKQAFSKKVKALNDQLRYFKAKCYESPKVNKAEANARHILKMVLTDNQIALLSNRKRRVNWTNEEISVAFTLRYYSKKCYIYLRNKLHYPLPSLSTLRKWNSVNGPWVPSMNQADSVDCSG